MIRRSFFGAVTGGVLSLVGLKRSDASVPPVPPEPATPHARSLGSTWYFTEKDQITVNDQPCLLLSLCQFQDVHTLPGRELVTGFPASIGFCMMFRDQETLDRAEFHTETTFQRTENGEAPFEHQGISYYGRVWRIKNPRDHEWTIGISELRVMDQQPGKPVVVVGKASFMSRVVE